MAQADILRFLKFYLSSNNMPIFSYSKGIQSNDLLFCSRETGDDATEMFNSSNSPKTRPCKVQHSVESVKRGSIDLCLDHDFEAPTNAVEFAQKI